MENSQATDNIHQDLLKLDHNLKNTDQEKYDITCLDPKKLQYDDADTQIKISEDNTKLFEEDSIVTNLLNNKHLTKNQQQHLQQIEQKKHFPSQNLIISELNLQNVEILRMKFKKLCFDTQISDVDELIDEIEILKNTIQKLISSGKIKFLKKYQDKLLHLEQILRLHQHISEQETQQKTSMQTLQKKLESLMIQSNISQLGEIDNKIISVKEGIEILNEQGDTEVAQLTQLLVKLEEIKILNEKIMKCSPKKQTKSYESIEAQLLTLFREKLLQLGLKEEDNLNSILMKKKKIIAAKKISNKSHNQIVKLEQQQLKIIQLIQMKDSIKYYQNYSNMQKTQGFPNIPKQLYQGKCSITLPNGQVKKIQYLAEETCGQFSSRIGIELCDKLQFEIKKGSTYVPLAKHQKFGELISGLPNIEAKISEMFSVEGDQKNLFFIKGTSLEEIKRKFKIRGSYHYFTEAFVELEQTVEELSQNLKLLQCEFCHINFKGKVQRNRIIPLNKKMVQGIKYLHITGPNTLFISECKVDGKWFKVSGDETLNQCSKGKKIQELKLEYNIELKIDIIYQKRQREADFCVYSSYPISKAKQLFEPICNIVAKLQKWIINDKQIDDFETFQSLGVFQARCRVEVHQVLNLQYYGFSDQYPIQERSYRQFFIESDQDFIKHIKQQNFPLVQYEGSFREICLGMIFAAVKKHCRIKSALDCIRQLVTFSQKGLNLWKPRFAIDKSFFNQHFVLHNILHSATDEVKIQFMRVYKHHSPLPLFSWNTKGERVSFLQYHYWISTKSLTIVSTEINQFLKGKSTFLNKIFNTEFELSNGRHPICSKSVYIQYNIYRNEDILIDLVDVSSNSISQVAKIKLCQSSNILIIHFTSDRLEQTVKWLEINCPHQLIILVERQSSIMDNRENFRKQLDSNSLKINGRVYSIPEMSQQNYSHFIQNFELISNQIHSYIQQVHKKYDTTEQQWKFTEYSGWGKEASFDSTQKLLQIQKHFSEIICVQLSNLENQQNKIGKKLGDVLLFKQQKYIDRFMSKLREFIRITRNKRLKIFSAISKIELLLQKQNTIKIIDSQLKKYFDQLYNIPDSQMTPFLKTKIQWFQVQEINTMKIQEIHNLVRQIAEHFIFEIKPRQFSIQNFWRAIAKLFDVKEKLQSQSLLLLQKAKNLYHQQFSCGRTFQIINGDSLEMPINLLKSNVEYYEDKKIMVIGIFGPQSSGKSTLLNFLFGCDFLSSDGRCTSGVYGTYYEINNKIIPNCNGFLLLDTEGLFANYQRCDKKGQNFDNKLVLFLIKTCDILILNTRGDVDKNCENILDLAFDSELMEHKTGVRYPNFYIILNQTGGQMNEQQRSEIRGLRKRIINVAPKMEQYICSSQSDSLPLAFNTISQEIRSKKLQNIQMKTKTPTSEFYNQTKKLAQRLVQILEIRGKSSLLGRNLEEIYNQMFSVWSTIINLPMLTKYTNRILKKFQDQISIWRHQFYRNTQCLIEGWKSNIPGDLRSLVDWQELIKKQFQIKITNTIEQFQKRFSEGADPQRNTMIKNVSIEIQPKMFSYFERLRIQIQIKKFLLEVRESENRGLDNLARSARKLKFESYLKGVPLQVNQKQEAFKRVWEDYDNKMKKKINHIQTAEQVFKNIKQLYERQLKCSNNRIHLFQRQLSSLDFNKSFAQFCSEMIEKILSICPQHLRFQRLDIQPVISTPKSGPTDLTFKYLDMRQFFQFKSKLTEYFFRIDRINDCVILNEARNYFQQTLKSNPFICRFLDLLKKDLQLLKCQLDMKFAQYIFSSFIIKLIQRRGTDVVIDKNANTNNLLIVTPEKTKNILFQIRNLGYFKFGPFKILHQDNLKKEIVRQYGYFGYYFNSSKPLIFTTLYSIEHFIRQNIQQIKQIAQILEAQLATYLEADLNSIGLIVKQVQFTYRQVKILLKEPKPIIVLHPRQIKEKISRFGTLFNRRALESNYSQMVYSGRSYKIATYHTEQIDVKSKFRNEKLLKSYKTKHYDQLSKDIHSSHFKSFLYPYLHTKLIFETLIQQICKMHKKIDVESCILNLMNCLKKQIADFNKDLQQISSSLTLNFITALHEFCLLMIWKYFEERQWKSRLQILDQLKSEELKQHQIFIKILDTDYEKNSDAAAAILVNKYKEYMIQLNKNQKKAYIEKFQRGFIQNYSRKKVQNWIDADMAKCDNPQKIFDYLINPAMAIEDYYKTFIDQQQKKLNELFSSNVLANINQFENITKNIREKIIGQQSSWNSDQIIRFANPSTTVRDIFLKLMSTGETISSDMKDNPFNLKPGVTFSIKQPIILNSNLSFFKESFDFQICNYAMFINYLFKHLSMISKELEEKIAITSDQKQSFRLSVQIQLCTFNCPCCNRLCDIDMRSDPHHKLHKCQSGHQMRAIKGIRVQKKQINSIKYYASILRCEDIQDFSLFRFNGNDYKWRQFCLLKKDEWDFKGSNVLKQQQLFEHMWSKAGKIVCQYREKEDKEQMIFQQYSEQAVYLLQRTTQTQFIILIDGSYSMRGKRWNQLKQSLKQILRDLSMSESNRISIIVFTQCYGIVYQNKEVTEINVNAIAFPGGLTSFSEAFKGALTIMHKFANTMNLSLVFISDGQDNYPDDEVEEMKKIKTQTETHRLTFNYVSIFIGGKSDSPIMDCIAKQLDGSNRWVHNASQISATFKEILNHKK